MRVYAFLLGAVVLIACACLMVASGCATYHVSQDLVDLQLADDASTPQQKAQFLGDFISKMESRHLPEYASFIFQNDRIKVSNQMKVLASLKKRCDDLAAVDPSSLGYAQGMQQISGQEFDHATSEIERIFDKALTVQAGWFTFYGWLPVGAIGVLLVVAGLAGDH